MNILSNKSRINNFVQFLTYIIRQYLYYKLDRQYLINNLIHTHIKTNLSNKTKKNMHNSMTSTNNNSTHSTKNQTIDYDSIMKSIKIDHINTTPNCTPSWLRSPYMRPSPQQPHRQKSKQSYVYTYTPAYSQQSKSQTPSHPTRLQPYAPLHNNNKTQKSKSRQKSHKQSASVQKNRVLLANNLRKNERQNCNQLQIKAKPYDFRNYGHGDGKNDIENNDGQPAHLITFNNKFRFQHNQQHDPNIPTHKHNQNPVYNLTQNPNLSTPASTSIPIHRPPQQKHPKQPIINQLPHPNQSNPYPNPTINFLNPSDIINLSICNKNYKSKNTYSSIVFDDLTKQSCFQSVYRESEYSNIELGTQDINLGKQGKNKEEFQIYEFDCKSRKGDNHNRGGSRSNDKYKITREQSQKQLRPKLQTNMNLNTPNKFKKYKKLTTSELSQTHFTKIQQNNKQNSTHLHNRCQNTNFSYSNNFVNTNNISLNTRQRSQKQLRYLSHTETSQKKINQKKHEIKMKGVKNLQSHPLSKRNISPFYQKQQNQKINRNIGIQIVNRKYLED